MLYLFLVVYEANRSLPEVAKEVSFCVTYYCLDDTHVILLLARGRAVGEGVPLPLLRERGDLEILRGSDSGGKADRVLVAEGECLGVLVLAILVEEVIEYAFEIDLVLLHLLTCLHGSDR